MTLHFDIKSTSQDPANFSEKGKPIALYFGLKLAFPEPASFSEKGKSIVENSTHVN